MSEPARIIVRFSKSDVAMHSNVLIIGPSREILQVLSDKLNADYHVFAARNLAGALSLIEKQPIQVVIIAAGMLPDAGRVLCRRLKAEVAPALLPVILITAEDGAEVRRKCLEAGADDHIGGPVFREHLDVLIRHLIARRGRVKPPVKPRGLLNPPVAVSEQEDILQRLHACLSDHARNRDLSVDQLARLMHMSRPTLYRKIKTVTRLTPNELINEIRLKQAAELLAVGDYRVFEVARMVGYTSQSSFGKSFLKQYKMTPATYQRMKKVKDAA